MTIYMFGKIDKGRASLNKAFRYFESILNLPKSPIGFDSAFITRVHLAGYYCIVAIVFFFFLYLGNVQF